MNIPQALSAVALTVLATTAAPPAAATVLVDNLLEPQRDTSILSAAFWAAQSFTTAADATVLASIELWLGAGMEAPAVFAELHADADGPAGALTAFVVPALAGGPTRIEQLPAAAPVALAPATTYWVVLGTSDPGEFGWTYASGNAQSGPGVLGNYRYSDDSGASWIDFGSDNPYLMRVHVAAVPELPASALLAAGLLLLRLRSRAGAAARLPAR